MQLRSDDLVGLNQRFAGAPPEAVLRFVHDTFGPRAALLSSMQRAGLSLAHLANQAGLSFDVLFVDTGVLHAQTLRARDDLARTHRHLHVRTLVPRQTFEQQTESEGLLYLSPEGQERCCDLRKSVPLQGERGTYDALVAALRRGEGGKRKSIDSFALDPDMQALRVHPLAHVADDWLDTYAATHPDLVENALHRMGFPTIGCYTCTTPVRPDEDERAGRWRHLEHVRYCGINPTDGEAPAAPMIELDDRYREALVAG